MLRQHYDHFAIVDNANTTERLVIVDSANTTVLTALLWCTMLAEHY